MAGHINEVFLLPLRFQRFFYPRLLDCLGPLKLGDVRHRPHDGAIWMRRGGYQDPGRRDDAIRSFPFLLEMCGKRVRALLVSGHVDVPIASFYQGIVDNVSPIYLIHRNLGMTGDVKPLIVTVPHGKILIQMV